MKTLLFLFFPLFAFAQHINWTPERTLQIEDFKSPATEIGTTQTAAMNTSVGISFDINMSMAQFMFTKNFNTKVSNTFSPMASSIIAPDVETARKMVAFAQYQFDLAELYARKLRRELFLSKKTFTDISFVRAAYDKINEEFATRQSLAGKASDLGQKEDVLADLRKEVLLEIAGLPDFCDTCKPKK